MARPRKIEDAAQRSFWLPATLIDRLNKEAEFRGVSMPEAARQILEAGIDGYHRASVRIRKERLKASIEAAIKDPMLRSHFEENKGKDDFPVPLGVLGAERANALVNALAAYREMRQAREEPVEEEEWVVILEGLGEDLPEEARDPFQSLYHADLVIHKDRDGNVLFKPSEQMVHFLRSRDITQEHVNDFRWLVEHGYLKYHGKGDCGPIYRWTK
jgi:hypothetical protein